jgi:hypothetical protein
MRRAWIAVVALVISGCSSDFIGESRLTEGQQCIIVGPGSFLADADKEFEIKSTLGADYPPIKTKGRLVEFSSGDHVQVESDTQSVESSGSVVDFQVRVAEMDKSAPEWLKDHPAAARNVTVVILDGPAKGERGEIPRYKLRPITSP